MPQDIPHGSLAPRDSIRQPQSDHRAHDARCQGCCVSPPPRGRVPPPWLALRPTPQIHRMLQARFRIHCGRRQPPAATRSPTYSFAAHRRPPPVPSRLHRDMHEPESPPGRAQAQCAPVSPPPPYFLFPRRCEPVQYRSPSYRRHPEIIVVAAQIDFLKLFS